MLPDYMPYRQEPRNAERGPRSARSHSTGKETITSRMAEPRKIRKSARLKTVLQRKHGPEKKPDGDLSWSAGKSGDQVQCKYSDAPLEYPLKRKRGQETPISSVCTQNIPREKGIGKPVHGEPRSEWKEAEQIFVTGAADPLDSWVKDKQWSRRYFEPHERATEELLEEDSSLDEIMALPPVARPVYVEIDGFRYPLPLKKAPISLHRRQSDSSLTESSDQKKRESKSTPYRDARYTMMLEARGSFLRDFDTNVPKTTTDMCHQLLMRDQTVPRDSLFRNDLFIRLCWKLQERNESMVIQDVARLIVPSAMNLAICGDKHLDILTESVNEGWTGSIPIEGPKPQPDYAVGFPRSAFTDGQLQKLSPLIGSVFDTSFFGATYRMYFPFLTCEVQCGAAALDIADRQNAHSMTIAVRSVVELYRAVKREKELDKEILAFSVSHDHSAVRLHGHYAVINGSGTTFYRHTIKKFDFTSEQGVDKWTAYKFTRNVYDTWMPTHLQRICSAIDQLPSSLDLGVTERPELPSEVARGLSQDTRSPLSEPCDVGGVSQDGDELDQVVLETPTPDTSVGKSVGARANEEGEKGVSVQSSG